MDSGVCCHRIGLSLFCECIFVDGTASERTGVYSADLVHLYADYGCDAVAIFWPVKSMVRLFVTRDLHFIVGFVCTESKECLELFKG